MAAYYNPPGRFGAVTAEDLFAAGGFLAPRGGYDEMTAALKPGEVLAVLVDRGLFTQCAWVDSYDEYQRWYELFAGGEAGSWSWWALPREVFG